jgi:hypothetical protein
LRKNVAQGQSYVWFTPQVVLSPEHSNCSSDESDESDRLDLLEPEIEVGSAAIDAALPPEQLYWSLMRTGRKATCSACGMQIDTWDFKVQQGTAPKGENSMTKEGREVAHCV